MTDLEQHAQLYSLEITPTPVDKGRSSPSSVLSRNKEAILHTLLIVVSVSAFSVAGVAARISLLNDAKTHGFFPQSSQITVNTLGSFVMGTLFGLHALLGERVPIMYIGMTVGFCGSFTTFSSWIFEIFNNTHNNAVEVFTGLVFPVVAVIVGVDTGKVLLQWVPSMSEEKAGRIDSIAAVISGVIAILAMTLAATIPFSTQTSVVACALGPIGALSRYVLATTLNGKFCENFMLGTLLANIAGVVILGAVSDCRSYNDWCDESAVGIAGSLSTVSSWALESFKIYKKSKLAAYIYCLGSVVVGTIVFLPFVHY